VETRILCGSYRVSERTEFLNNGYECAAWWTKISVEAGDYPVHGYLQGSSLHLYASLEGVIVEDNFQSLWGGVAFGQPYDQRQNAGKPATYSVFGRDYEAFASIHRMGDQSPWKIDLSTIPYELAACSDCGCVIHKNEASTRCPRCSVTRDQSRQNHARRRHRFLLATGYGIRTTRDSSHLDGVIAGSSDDEGIMRGYYLNILRSEVAAMRAVGPHGRIEARHRYPVPSYAFAIS